MLSSFASFKQIIDLSDLSSNCVEDKHFLSITLTNLHVIAIVVNLKMMYSIEEALYIIIMIVK